MKVREYTRSKLEALLKDGMAECETDITRGGFVEIRYGKARKKMTVQIVDDAPVEPVAIQESVTVVDVTPKVEEAPKPADAQPVEETKPAAEQKPKVSKRPYIEDVKSWLEVGSHSRKEIIDTVLAKYPTVSKSGITTFVTDLKNVKYSHFKPREVVEKDDKLVFADVIVKMAELAGIVQPATEPEAPDQAE